jgi:hypothetical protein
MTFANKVRHTLRKHGSLPGSSTSDHQHRPMNMRNGFLLALIGNNLRRV